LEIFSHVARRWRGCGRRERTMDTFFIGFRMGRVQRMRMIGLVGLMRAFGGSLGRMIVRVFVCLVCSLSYLLTERGSAFDRRGLLKNWRRDFVDNWTHVLTATKSNTRPNVPRLPHEMVPLLRRIFRRPAQRKPL